ncbi:heme-binding protein [Nakamurella flavida]|uniref:Heme-binding protein n=1 Tax=Nakamurella flavida TaxID=363630 RepID=A0A938YI19_9ACTN|nr:heme-binding protein [Nakamurella flavida]MBM9478070.1 heme-binding protein [Nakamurella flavida]MDP9778213.1 uncharacterized protein GlcG (DUF336 family) [Nakamurella flavida]
MTQQVSAVQSLPRPELHARQDVSASTALQIVAGVRQEAERRGVRMGIAVTDSAGQLVAALRMDGAQLVAVRLATDKAYTASAFGHPTDAWSQSSAPGGSDWGLASAADGRLIVFAGGIPLHADGELVGGVGVSGAAADVDAACARAGAAAVGLLAP